jgi:serine/threonine protein kinase
MPAPTSPSELLELVRKSGVVADDVLGRLANGPPLPETPPKLAAHLVKQGLLTPFQAKLLLAGRHRGFKLGPYVVLEHIAQGGMGAVYLAQHESLKRRVALKVLTADKDPLAVKRFAREARSAAALDHPNIVKLYDVAAQGQVQYLVMEYVDGQTLETMQSKAGRLPFAQLADWTAQVARGLQHAHDKGFVHRDIKPANLMVDKTGHAKVLDMGLARSDSAGDKLTEMMDRGAVVGTADYISPEQAMSGQCDIRADIYSLGATFYNLASGQSPYQGTTAQKLIAHQTVDPVRLDRVVAGFPPGLAAVVARMMAKKPDDRYQTPAEVAEALAPWASADDASSVDLGVHAPDSPGASTKRLAHPAARTMTTKPVTARHPKPAASTGRVAKVRAEAAPSVAAPARAGRPAWVVIAAAGAAGFVVVGAIAGALVAAGVL